MKCPQGRAPLRARLPKAAAEVDIQGDYCNKINVKRGVRK